MSSLLLKRKKVDDNGCVICPVCGEIIPLTNTGPRTLRHEVFTVDGKLRIVCPVHVTRKMKWEKG